MADEKYASVVVSVGDMASEFFAAGIVVLFGEGAPEELEDVAVIHRPTTVDGGIVAGDQVHLGDEVLTVLAVGDVADENLVNLGHLSLKRNGQHEVALPGDVCCDKGPIPRLQPGDVIRIITGGRNES
jgi:glucitol/sorbitol PTS system EIIA component